MPFLRPGEYAGVSAGYRLSGDAQWPTQIYDCKAAIRWVRANASKYGLDADHIGVSGRNAGAHLVLMLGVSGDVPELEGDIGANKGVSSKVAGVANFFGVSEIMTIIGQPSDLDRTKPDAPEAMLIGGPLRLRRSAPKLCRHLAFPAGDVRRGRYRARRRFLAARLSRRKLKIHDGVKGEAQAAIRKAIRESFVDRFRLVAYLAAGLTAASDVAA
jgi:alpha/beta hydrolase fold